VACALPPHAPPVPAAIVVRTSWCGYVRLQENGHVVRWHAPRWPGIARAGEGVWVRHTDGRLTLVRHGRVFWRSTWTRGSDAVFIRGRRIVYAAYPRRYENSEEVWLARIGGGEQRIARLEQPLGWTSAGLFLLWKDGNIVVRNANGRRVRTLHVKQSLFRPFGHTLLALLEDGRLVRTDGRTTTTLAHIRNRRYTLSDVLPGGLIVLVRTGGVRILDRDGRRYAFTRLPAETNVEGTIVRLPNGSIVFPTSVRKRNRNVTTVMLLQRGHRAVRLYTRSVPLSCANWTAIEYRSGRLLYSSVGRIALLDPAGRRAPVDLTAFANAIGGGEASASWAS
jgi:hypothetical protein